MLSVTINLEKEKLLFENLQKEIIENLSAEDKKEIAKSVLTSYLTNVIDYDRLKHENELLVKVRREGIKNPYNSYNSVKAENLINKTDDQIKSMSEFKNLMNNYKSPRESQIDEIQKTLFETLKEEGIKLVKENTELKEIIKDKDKEFKDNFLEISSRIMSNLAFNGLFDLINSARLGGQNESAINYLSTRFDQMNQNRF